MNELALFAGAGGGILGGGGGLDGELSAQLNVMPTQAKFWRNDKTMEFSSLSQFGLTLQLLTENRGQELLMSYLGAFHAKTSAQQVKAQVSKVQEVECGKRWQELLARYDPVTHLWKTAQCSLLEDLELSLQTWPRWGSMRNGACYLQPMLAHHTGEKESGSLPNNETFFHTPNTTGLDGGSNSRKALKKRMEQWPTPRSCSAMASTITQESAWNDKRNPNLETIVGQRMFPAQQAVQMWPTPDANMGMRGTQPDWQPIRKSGQPAQYTINQAVRDSYATPTARMWKDNGKSPSELNRNLETLAVQAGGKLNPTWVEWLMGWPMGWTDLKPLVMDKSHSAQQPLSTNLEKD